MKPEIEAGVLPGKPRMNRSASSLKGSGCLVGFGTWLRVAGG